MKVRLDENDVVLPSAPPPRRPWPTLTVGDGFRFALGVWLFHLVAFLAAFVVAALFLGDAWERIR